MTAEQRLITVGRVGSVYGVHGWVRVHSDTEPPERILEYQPWQLKSRRGTEAIVLEASKHHSNDLLVKFVGIDDREQAKGLSRSEIAVDADQLPPLSAGEYYWHQLEGLVVIGRYQGNDFPLGRVARIMETGANDVLVVKGETGSIDRRERLIPLLMGQTVKSVDLAAQQIVVEWDPQF